MYMYMCMCLKAFTCTVALSTCATKECMRARPSNLNSPSSLSVTPGNEDIAHLGVVCPQVESRAMRVQETQVYMCSQPSSANLDVL